MHEFISTDGDTDMRGELPRAIDRVEEHQITGAEIARIDVCAGMKLFGDGARHLDAVLSEYVPDKSAAIEP
jgi:hypothetical protein